MASVSGDAGDPAECGEAAGFAAAAAAAAAASASPSDCAAAVKAAANACFQASDFEGAIRGYTEAIGVLTDGAPPPADADGPPMPPVPAQRSATPAPLAVLFANRALSNMRLEHVGSALEDSTCAIRSDPGYVKGYYHHGAALMALGKFSEALSDFRAAVRLQPTREAREKVRACEKAAKLLAFSEAISRQESEPVSATLVLADVVVPADYDGVRLPDPVTLESVEALMESFREQKRLHPRYAFQILLQMKAIFERLDTLVFVDVSPGQKITVCGDTHGQFYDLLNIFRLNGLPSAEHVYLFNGDFVDRGSFSVEVVLTLFALKCALPDCVHLTRGNHETRGMNRMYGFEGEVKHKYSLTMYDLFQEIFCLLPLAYVLNRKVFVCHGGLSSTDGTTLEDIRKLDRNRQPPEEGLMSDLLWSDPGPTPGRTRSSRGVGWAFGPDITKAFLELNGLELVVRSHEVQQNGYKVESDGNLITVFSAPNYIDQIGNKGAFLTFHSDRMATPEFHTFEAVPHPHVPPMAYGMPGLGMFH